MSAPTLTRGPSHKRTSPPIAELPLVLTFPQAGRRLGISDNTVKRMVREGELPGVFYAGNAWRVPVESIERFIAAHQYGTHTPSAAMERSAANARAANPMRGRPPRKGPPSTRTFHITKAQAGEISRWFAAAASRDDEKSKRLMAIAERSGWNEHGEMALRVLLASNAETAFFQAHIVEALSNSPSKPMAKSLLGLLRTVEATLPACERSLPDDHADPTRAGGDAAFACTTSGAVPQATRTQQENA